LRATAIACLSNWWREQVDRDNETGAEGTAVLAPFQLQAWSLKTVPLVQGTDEQCQAKIGTYKSVGEWLQKSFQWIRPGHCQREAAATADTLNDPKADAANRERRMCGHERTSLANFDFRYCSLPALHL
jgi:hypothetical protein